MLKNRFLTSEDIMLALGEGFQCTNTFHDPTTSLRNRCRGELEREARFLRCPMCNKLYRVVRDMLTVSHQPLIAFVVQEVYEKPVEDIDITLEMLEPVFNSSTYRSAVDLNDILQLTPFSRSELDEFIDEHTTCSGLEELVSPFRYE